MGFLGWVGRVTLWIFALPLGVISTICHSRTKKNARNTQAIIAAVYAANGVVDPNAPVPVYREHIPSPAWTNHVCSAETCWENPATNCPFANR